MKNSDSQPPEIPTRGKVNMIVRDYARRTQTNYAEVWLRLYREMYYRYGYNVKARCKRSGRKCLDQIEMNGMIEALYAIASVVLSE